MLLIFILFITTCSFLISTSVSTSSQETQLNSHMRYDHKREGDNIKSKEFKSDLAEGATIRISHETSGYKVTIELHKDKCDDKLRSTIFNSSDLMLMDEYRLGPDEIIVQFEGASVQAEVARTDDYCREYYAVFQVPITGSYRLKVLRLRKDYKASREANFFPEMHHEVFLDTLIDDNLGFYAPVPCNKFVQGYWVTTSSKHLLVESQKIKDECRSGGLKRGLPLTTNILLHDEMTKDGCASDVENYGWNRKICKSAYNHERDGAGEIVSFGDPNITINRPYQYFKRRKILFIGDNHMKGLAGLFIGHVCHYDEKILNWNETHLKINNNDGNIQRVAYMKLYFREDQYDDYREPIDKCRKDPDIENCSAYKKATSSQEKRRIFDCFKDPSSRACDLFDLDCAGSSVAYISAMHCQKDLVRYMEGYDYVIFNCGHHTAKSVEYPYHVYRDTIKSFSNAMMDAEISKVSSLFYLENSAIPIHQDDLTKAEVDRRTYHRLMMFDAISKHEMLKTGLGVRVVSAFFSTLAMYDKFCDCGHYPWAAKMPQLLTLSDQIQRANRHDAELR